VQSGEDLENALNELKKSDANLRRIIATVPALAWCNRPDGSIEFVNQRWQEYTGLSPQEAHGWGWKTSIHPEDLPRLMGNGNRSATLISRVSAMCNCSGLTVSSVGFCSGVDRSVTKLVR
jgi:PAS domain-containing protein